MFKLPLLMTVVALLSFGCVSTPAPDTNAKKLATAEITFNEILLLVDKNIPRMSDAQIMRVSHALVKAKTALDTARFALSMGALADFTDSVASVNSSITILRAILEELEKKEVSYEFSIESYYTA